jgi:hypothetical protein
LEELSWVIFHTEEEGEVILRRWPWRNVIEGTTERGSLEREIKRTVELTRGNGGMEEEATETA